jgi:DNA-binding HxlR family transcriptional regulator
MPVPRPGRVVRGSATGRPLMAALDLLGRRWALRILWELMDGPRGARELRRRCDAMSPSVLYQRLAELTEAQLISQDADNRYRLTPVGQALGSAIAPLDQWAKTWARQTVASPRQP